MNINVSNLKVGLAASNDETKKAFQSIHVTKDYTEATNGTIMARVSLPHQYESEDIPSCVQTSAADKLEPFLVPAKAMMKIRPLTQKRKCSRISCLDGQLYVDVEKTNQNCNAKFFSSDIESTICTELQKADYYYPDIDRVIPDGTPLFHASYRIEYLETLLAIAKSVGSERIMLDLHDPKRPLVLSAEKDGQSFTGLIMPHVWT